jgi:hypothetical protein
MSIKQQKQQNLKLDRIKLQTLQNQQNLQNLKLDRIKIQK